MHSRLTYQTKLFLYDCMICVFHCYEFIANDFHVFNTYQRDDMH